MESEAEYGRPTEDAGVAAAESPSEADAEGQSEADAEKTDVPPSAADDSAVTASVPANGPATRRCATI